MKNIVINCYCLLLAVFTVAYVVIGIIEYFLERCPSMDKYSQRMMLGLVYQYILQFPIIAIMYRM